MCIGGQGQHVWGTAERGGTEAYIQTVVVASLALYVSGIAPVQDGKMDGHKARVSDVNRCAAPAKLPTWQSRFLVALSGKRLSDAIGFLLLRPVSDRERAHRGTPNLSSIYRQCIPQCDFGSDLFTCIVRVHSLHHPRQTSSPESTRSRLDCVLGLCLYDTDLFQLSLHFCFLPFVSPRPLTQPTPLRSTDQFSNTP